MLFVALFVIAGAQTLIVQQQGNLDGLNDKIETAEKDSERLRIELAELKSYERIVGEAQKARDGRGASARLPPASPRRRRQGGGGARRPPTPPVTAAPKATKKAEGFDHPDHDADHHRDANAKTTTGASTATGGSGR